MIDFLELNIPINHAIHLSYTIIPSNSFLNTTKVKHSVSQQDTQAGEREGIALMPFYFDAHHNMSIIHQYIYDIGIVLE